MSYLDSVRLVFSGKFQADVSTVNNKVQNYNNADFTPDYGNKDIGSWNPEGTGAFRLLNCAVTSVHYADGTSTSDASKDPAIGMVLNGGNTRTSGKLVDLDPQWQLASAPWGFQVRLSQNNGQLGSVFSGDYQPNAFRDLAFGKMLRTTEKGIERVGHDPGASALFQSILESVQWTLDGIDSRFLKELQAASDNNCLSIRLTTLAYQDLSIYGGFTTGMVSGVIGPYRADEPSSFVIGRRFIPQVTGKTNPACNEKTIQPACAMNNFSAVVTQDSEQKKYLLLDLSNALPLKEKKKGDAASETDMQASTQMWPQGTLSVICTKPDGSTITLPTTEVLKTYEQPNWWLDTAGVVSLPLSADQAEIVENNPLSLLAVDNGTTTVLASESASGVFVGIEPLVHRIDTHADGTPAKGSFDLWTVKFGARTAASDVRLSLDNDETEKGDPTLCVPADAFTFPATLAVGESGKTTVNFSFAPLGEPRGYIDGQLYFLNYQVGDDADSFYGPFGQVSIHARSAFAVIENPIWDHISGIMQQYRNLYPIMSKKMFDIGNVEDCREHARLLHLGFSMPMEDPNHMPATRDLSEGKRQTILNWLQAVIDEQEQNATPYPAPGLPQHPMMKGKASPAPQPQAQKVTSVAEDDENISRGKSAFARKLGLLK